MIVLFVLRFWKKIKLTGLTGTGLILIFIPRSLGLGKPNFLYYVIIDLALSIIGVILVSYDIIRVVNKKSVDTN